MDLPEEQVNEFDALFVSRMPPGVFAAILAAMEGAYSTWPCLEMSGGVNRHHAHLLALDLCKIIADGYEVVIDTQEGDKGRC